MKTIFCFLLLNLFALKVFSQNTCESLFVNDTMSLMGTKKILEGKYLETTLKKGSIVRFFQSNEQKYYLRFLVTENFYFDKTDVLEIVSGHKSFYANEMKQFKVNKNTGLFVLEIPKNYISQLKDHGITAIIFAHAETHFTRGDAKQIKEICGCFYNSIQNNKQ